MVKLSVPRSESDSEESTGQLAEARRNVFAQNDQWKITFPDGTTRQRTFYYKTALNPGEKYMLIPTYSPENSPIGYNSTITANATMDISAARDGLYMVITMGKAVKRDGYEAAVANWEDLLELLPDYKVDKDGALREWGMNEYTENNNHPPFEPSLPGMACVSNAEQYGADKIFHYRDGEQGSII